MEEIPPYSGRALNPTRQPTVPPPEERAQKDAGFFRFLKKHSSPTHQRVTAGGRIVPMEQRGAPPIFLLSRNSQATCPMQSSEAQTQATTPANIATEIGSVPQGQVPQQMTEALLSQAALNTCGPYISPLAPVAGLVPRTEPFSTLISPHNLPSPYPQTTMPLMAPTGTEGIFGALSMPMYNVPMSPLTPMTPVGMWPYPDPYTTQFGLASSSDTQFMAMHQMLAQNTERFDELDRQLKLMDRHRAMSNHDRALAMQRMVIVQQRAEAKQNISWLSNALHLEQNQLMSLGTGTGHIGTQLNVEAPVYVPKGTTQTQPTTSQKGMSRQDASDYVKDSVRSNGSGRAIPIIAPDSPKKSQVRNVEAFCPASPEQQGVDAWGVRLGQAPPELQRQQSDMLEAMISVSSKSSESFKDDGFGDKQRRLQHLVPGPTSPQFNDNMSIASSDDETPHGHRGQAPAEVEATYERQLDALRRARGIVTSVVQADGSTMEVEGQDLQRPPSANMTEFERDYWSRKPMVTEMSLRIAAMEASLSNPGSDHRTTSGPTDRSLIR